MRVELLGPVRIDGDGDALSPRDRVALTVLALEQDRAVSVDTIADALWGEDAPPSRAKVVHGCISRLRRRLGPDAIVTRADGYHLELGPEDLDVWCFEDRVARARELAELGEHDRAAWVAGEALALWSGPPLSAVDDWDRGRAERQRLLVLHDGAEELRVAALLQAGRPDEALPLAVELVEAQPLREARWLLLARAQYQCGEQAGALATLERARASLAEELGLDPSPALEELQRQILHHDEQLAVAPTAAASTDRCPYPGLLPFGEEDSEDFFGREAEVEDCHDRLVRFGVVVVAGPSGSGKSSLVRSGVAARCRADGRSVGVVVATAHLTEDLARLGPLPDVLVIDQLEALTAPDVPEAARRMALDALVDLVLRTALVLVARSDCLGGLAEGRMAALIEGHLLLLQPMRPAALRRAIRGPAERHGLLLEPGLVDLLLSEVNDEPAALPLLAHALRSTWARREGRTLTVAGYRDAGGIRQAITRTAEAVHRGLDARGRARLRELLLRMVARSEDGSAIAAPIDSDTIDDPTSEVVVERLVAARLVTVDGDRIMLGHEALLRAWPRLRLWLDEGVAGQRILRHLTVAAHEWAALDRPVSELYRGVRLEEAIAWWESEAPHLAPVERDYLEAAVAQRDHEDRQRAQRAAAAERTNRRLRRRLRSVVVAAVVALVAGLVAASSAYEARRASLVADARRVGSQALLTERADTSLLLAVGAVGLEDSPDTRASLLTALGRAPALVRVLDPADDGALSGIAIDPDGDVVTIMEEGRGARFLDLATGAELAVLPEPEGPVGIADPTAGTTAFHPDGGPVAHGLGGFDVGPGEGDAAGERLLLWLLDPATYEREQALVLDTERPTDRLLPVDLAWSPDGAYLAALLHLYESRDEAGILRLARRPSAARLAVWPRGEAQALQVTDEVPTASASLAWGADGSTIVTATDPHALRAGPVPATSVWDAVTLARLRVVEGVGHPVAVSPDGRRLAGVAVESGGAARVVLLDAATGVELRRLDRHDDTVRAIAFAPDGSTVASSSGPTVKLSDMTTGRPVEELTGHAGEVADLAYTPDGQSLVTVGTDGAALVWDVTGTRRLLRVRARADQPLRLRPLSLLPVHASVDPAGGSVVFVGATVRAPGGEVAAGVQVLHASSQHLGNPVVAGNHPWRTVLWTPSGTPVTLDDRGTLGIWDPPSGDLVESRNLRVVGSLAGMVGDEIVILHHRSSGVIRVSADGSGQWGQLRVVADDDALQLSPLSMRPIATSTVGPRVAVFAGAPIDGQLGSVMDVGQYASLLRSDHLVIVELDALEQARVLALGFDGAAAAFDPTGERLAVGGRLGELAILSETGEPVGPSVVGHLGAVTSVTWAAGGQVVATGGEDGRVVLWDGDSGRSLGSLQVAPPGRAAAVSSTAESHEVFVATTDGALYSLDIRVSTWLDTACAIAGRALTEEEWSSVAGGRAMPELCPGPTSGAAAR